MTRAAVSPILHSGERPGSGEGFAYDEARHVAAYLYARELARDRQVLDAGCGEGFGTVLLAETARRVTGIDYSAAAVKTATAKYKRPNLDFRHVDVYKLPGLGLRFDLVTNFQVLEHLADPVEFLTAVRAALKPGGVLMLATPNRLTSVSENPYHLHEYVAGELESLLRPLFGRIDLYSMMGNDKVRAFDAERARQVRRILRFDPFGLRKILPERVVKWLFGRLAVRVRRRVAEVDQASRSIAPSDFHVLESVRPEALDLIALCRV
ncbi:MAG: methyltransferase domain-containing protein [Deltaproteobacteria bacterium]|nr:methyltransferase domain-containing protein [Deltaproteobacteria bacterium]